MMPLLLCFMVYYYNEVRVVRGREWLKVHYMNNDRESVRNLEPHDAAYHKHLVEVSRTLFAPDVLSNTKTIYDGIYEHVQRLMPTEVFFVARYNQFSDKLVIDYSTSDHVLTSQEDTSLIDWLHHFLLEEYPSYLFASFEEFATALQTISPQAIDAPTNEPPCQSLLFVPICYRNEKIGVISVQSYYPNRYDESHATVLQEIGIQAGLAIVNARTYEELRRAAQHAQESERLKNYFLMTTSHELRTPLTSIQGYLELLHNYSSDLDASVKQRFIAKAQRACEELVLMLGNVMDTSRVDQDGMTLTLKYSSVSVLHVVSLILEIMEPTTVREKRQVEVTIDKDIYIWGDDLRLRQILLNLVSNALKYTPPSTKIAIAAERVERVAQKQLAVRISVSHGAGVALSTECYIVLSVRDWGSGIAPYDQKCLFAKFMRLPDAVKSGQRGSGLGLYLCRQLTEAMGGFIWVESSGIVGEGSTFLIALPEYTP